jgi:hypothetical protein
MRGSSSNSLSIKGSGVFLALAAVTSALLAAMIASFCVSRASAYASSASLRVVVSTRAISLAATRANCALSNTSLVAISAPVFCVFGVCCRYMNVRLFGYQPCCSPNPVVKKPL